MEGFICTHSFITERTVTGLRQEEGRGVQVCHLSAETGGEGLGSAGTALPAKGRRQPSPAQLYQFVARISQSEHLPGPEGGCCAPRLAWSRAEC